MLCYVSQEKCKHRALEVKRILTWIDTKVRLTCSVNM